VNGSEARHAMHHTLSDRTCRYATTLALYPRWPLSLLRTYPMLAPSCCYPHNRRLGNAICTQVSLGNDLDVQTKYAIRLNQETTKGTLASMPMSTRQSPYLPFLPFCCMKLSPSNSLLHQPKSHPTTVPETLAPLNVCRACFQFSFACRGRVKYAI
jgi:hypothetical protein